MFAGLNIVQGGTLVAGDVLAESDKVPVKPFRLVSVRVEDPVEP